MEASRPQAFRFSISSNERAFAVQVLACDANCISKSRKLNVNGADCAQGIRLAALDAHQQPSPCCKKARLLYEVVGKESINCAKKQSVVQ